MARAIVYTLDENNEIIAEMEYDYDQAIQLYYSGRDWRGNRLFVGLKGKKVPFKKKAKTLRDVIRTESIGEDQSRSDRKSDIATT